MSAISDITDTAIWVAAYRAEEHERRDALFRDPWARLLIGKEGDQLARRTQGSRYTAWSVVIRTHIIDQFIHSLLAQNKIDLVLNLGAGLDTRPYRMTLPKNLQWIEVDFEKIIALKNEKLRRETPSCQLERYALDLSLKDIRQELFTKISARSQSTLILTEGVIPYLSNDDAAALAQELYHQIPFRYWITEYYSPEILRFLRTPKRLKQMEKAPFLFYPEDWFAFFQNLGWEQVETRYFGEESERLGRRLPTPGWLKQGDHQGSEEVKRYLAYTLQVKKTAP